METLKEMMANYQAWVPITNFLAGTAIGVTTRLIDNYRTRKDGKERGWKPGGAAVSSLIITGAGQPNPLNYAFNVGLSVLGSYIGHKVVNIAEKKDNQKQNNLEDEIRK